jgi:predicted nucleotidyltransferase
MPKTSSASARAVYPRFSLDELVADLRNRLPSLAEKLPIQRVVLFGSWAHGRFTAYSDFDVLVVYRGPAQADAYRTVRLSIPLRGLEPHVYGEDEAESLRSTLDRMIEGGITLL